MPDILDKLNPEQLRAATTTEGYIRVIAGAGSGKTRALTARYAYLVSEIGIAPEKILCVTFTNRGAHEKKSRARRTRPFISLAARFVKVTQRMFSGAIPSSDTR